MDISKNKTLKFVFSDHITKLKNKDYYFKIRKEIANDMIKDLINKNIVWSILFCDANNLKFVNDNYGHDIGDQGLEALGKTLKDSVRVKRTRQDIVTKSTNKKRSISIRYGGDEFLILLPNCKKSEAKIVKNRIQKNIENNLNFTKGLTLSIGISDTTDIPTPLKVKSNKNLIIFIEKLIKIAEEDMYKDKAKEIKLVSKEEQISIISKNIVRLGNIGLDYTSPEDMSYLVEILKEYINKLKRK